MKLAKKQLKKYFLYGIKWQGGTPVIALVLWLLPVNNILIKTIIANIIGALLFYKIDQWIFKSDKRKDGN